MDMVVNGESYTDENSKYPESTLRICRIDKNGVDGTCGFHLTRTKWDPYPWIGGVDSGSAADNAGLKVGDCVLEINGEDILGLRVSEIANKAQNIQDAITMLLWNAGKDTACDPQSLCCAPMPTTLNRLCCCLSSIMSFLECPVCFEVISPPAHQCPHGHLICFKCRVHTDKCPICRSKFTIDRSLLADQIYNSLMDIFQLNSQPKEAQTKKLWERLFGKKSAMNLIKPSSNSRVGNSNSKLNSPTMKDRFISRLNLKASSENNLTSIGNKNFPELFSKNTREKCLSSNEVFQRRGRILSSTSCSQQGSIESVNVIISHFKCPVSKFCNEVSSNDVIQHVQEFHEGPVIQYMKPQFTLKFPFSLPETAIITINCFHKLFMVKIQQENISQDIKIFAWITGTGKEVGNFKISTTLIHSSDTQDTQIVLKAPVGYLVANDKFDDIHKERITISKNVLQAHSLNDSFSIKIDITCS